MAKASGTGAPPAVVEALLGKVPLTSEGFVDLATVDYQATAAAFTASGLSSLSLVARLQKDLATAISEGQSLGSFKAQVSTKLKEALSDNRLELIYRINVHQAYMAGRWEGINESKDDYPYLQYDALDDGRSRPAHQALDGVVYPVDSPFWSGHYPPNGFRCRCNVRQVSRESLDRKGLKVSQAKPKNQPAPDPGWNGNQAKDQVAYLSGLEAKKLGSVSAGFARRYILGKNRRDPSFQHFTLGKGLPHEIRPIGVIDSAVAAELGSETQVVYLKAEVAAKQWRNHPEIGPDAYLGPLGKTLKTSPDLIVNAEEGKQYFYRVRGDKKKLWKAVVRKDQGRLLLVSYHKVNLRDLSAAVKKTLRKGE